MEKVVDPEVRNLLRGVYFFRDLKDEELDALSLVCERTQYSRGDIVFQEGDKADYFFIIIHGSVEVWKDYFQTQPDLLAVHTDGHLFGEMARVGELEELQRSGRFEHRPVSGKEARNRANPLFAVNYLDRQVRKDVANHVRQTTRAARNVNDLMNRLAIYRVMHNYRKSYRLRPDQRDDRYHGEVAGLARERIEEEVGDSYYRKRRFFTHEVLPAEGWRTWARMWGTPMGEGNVYIPRFILD